VKPSDYVTPRSNPMPIDLALRHAEGMLRAVVAQMATERRSREDVDAVKALANEAGVMAAKMAGEGRKASE
jgi:hypothetical protein